MEPSARPWQCRSEGLRLLHSIAEEKGGNNPKLNKINKYKLKSSVILCSDSQISEAHEDTKLKLKPEELLQAVAPSPSLENNAVTNTHTHMHVSSYTWTHSSGWLWGSTERSKRARSHTQCCRQVHIRVAHSHRVCSADYKHLLHHSPARPLPWTDAWKLCTCNLNAGLSLKQVTK